MYSRSASRFALTLLELLVVLGVIALLIGLLLPAVQKVRSAAARIKSLNNFHQLILATHQYADNRDGLIPDKSGAPDEAGRIRSVHVALLPYVEQGNLYRQYVGSLSGGLTDEYSLPVFYSPSDPSLSVRNFTAYTSYPVNACLFNGRFKLGTVPDGTSNTVAFAEHYGFACGGVSFRWLISGDTLWSQEPPWNSGGLSESGFRTPTFADRAFGDYVPDMSPVVTFQVAPRLQDCDPKLAQTPHSGGLLVAFADGSTRTISSGTSSRTYWAAVTPAGGDVLGNDW